MFWILVAMDFRMDIGCYGLPYGYWLLWTSIWILVAMDFRMDIGLLWTSVWILVAMDFLTVCNSSIANRTLLN